MTDASSTTLAQLLFKKQPLMNFAHLVADTDATMHDGTCRIAAHPLWDDGGVRADETHSRETTAQVASDVLNASIDEMPDSAISSCPRRADATTPTAEVAMLTPTRQLHPVQDINAEEDPAEIDRILQKLEDSLALRAERQPAAPDPAMPGAVRFPLEATRAPQWAQGSSGADMNAPLHQQAPRQNRNATDQDQIDIANDTPHVPHPMLKEMKMLREALYAEEAAPRTQGLSVQLRLACHAINATLIVIALPVGAAMMTYSVLRGENINTSARMLAIIGMAVGVQHSPIGQHIMTLV